MIILIVIAILLIIVLTLYNNLVKAKNRVKQAESGIDVYLNQRFDLIPNLVECVKAYSKHEQSIFTEVTNLRSAYMKQPRNIKNAENLNNKMNQLVAVAENYPDLKASTNFTQLSDELSGTENRIAVARRDYNDAVKTYNLSIKQFPNSILAGMFGFDTATYFEASESSKDVPNVSLE